MDHDQDIMESRVRLLKISSEIDDGICDLGYSRSQGIFLIKSLSDYVVMMNSFFIKFKSYYERKNALHQYINKHYYEDTTMQLMSCVVPHRYADIDLYNLLERDNRSAYNDIIKYYEQTPTLCIHHIKRMTEINKNVDQTINDILRYIIIPVEGEILKEINRIKLLNV